MKLILILLICTTFFLPSNSFSQEKCDIAKLSSQEKVQLSRFWTQLRKAVKNKNKLQLRSLFLFPVTCSFCITEASNNSPYVVITKNNFTRYLQKTIFSKYFLEVLNKKKILQILHSSLGENGLCNLSFSFPIVKPSLRGEGLQGFFTIKKNNGKYKIVSAWSVP